MFDPELKSADKLIKIMETREPGVLRMIISRHGRTRLNLQHIIQHWTPDGDELVDEGRQGAVELGKRISHLPMEAIFSSDFNRAFETAEHINAQLKNPVEVIPLEDLRDFNFGDFSGVDWGESLKKINPVFYDMLNHDRASIDCPNGEDYASFCKRMERALTTILDRHHEGNLLIVAHSFSSHVLLLLALGMDLKKHALGGVKNTSLNVVEFRGEKHGKMLYFSGHPENE